MRNNTVCAERKQKLRAELGEQPVWGVVSTFAADTLSYGLTFVQARELAVKKASREREEFAGDSL